MQNTQHIPPPDPYMAKRYERYERYATPLNRDIKSCTPIDMRRARYCIIYV